MTTAGLYLRCLAWGLATGAAMGGGTGAIVGLLTASQYGVGIVFLALAVGAVYGVLVAALPSLLGAGTEQVLGWAENRRALDAALAGWEGHMGEPDGMAWVRRRLTAAAENAAAPA